MVQTTLAEKDDKAEPVIKKLHKSGKVPVLFSGPYSAANRLLKDPYTARSIVEGGFHHLQRPKSAENEGWRNLCAIVWKYQWVRRPLEELGDDIIISTLYMCSQGITGIMIRLFIVSQVEAIESGVERVDATFLRKVYQEHFGPVHDMLEILRLGHEKAYEDLHLKMMVKLDTEEPHNWIADLRQRLEQQFRKQLGMPATLPEPPTRAKPRSNKSTTELAAAVFGKTQNCA